MTPFHLLHPQSRAQRVNDFLIWRQGRAVEWDCTYQDLSEEVGLTVSAVRSTCRRRGWICRGEALALSGAGRIAVDEIMRTDDARIRGRA